MARSSKTPGLNASSMADIAFLMLIFFLMTSTMDVDTGIMRILPPPLPDDIEAPDVKVRNVMNVLISSQDRLLVNRKLGDIKTLKNDVIDFMSIHPNDPNFPEVSSREVPLLGTVPTSKGIVSLKNDRGTSYEMYIRVQDELASAFKVLRDKLSMEHFGKKYSDLVDEEQIDAIEKAIPIRVSEAEPVNVGGN